MLALLGLYVLAQLALGCYIARRVRTVDDFLVAGRRLGPVLATTSLFATWFGAESCVGAAGSVYRHGLGWHSVEPFAYGLCLCLLGLFFASRLWRTGVTTVADLFEQRFHRSASTLAALLMVPTSLLWAAAQVRAFGNVLAVNSDGLLAPEIGLLIAAAVVVAYTAAGGLLADVVTDLVQGIALVLGLGALLVAVLWQLGGPAAAVEQLAALPPRTPAEPLPALAIAEAWAIPLLGSLAAQEAISRTLAARSGALARSAGLYGGLLYLGVGTIPVALGLLGPLLVAGLDDPEHVLPALAQTHMPPIVNLLFAGALVSAMLSTVDSSLLAASAVLTRNVIRTAQRSPRQRLLLARAAAVACGAAAYGLAHCGDSVSALVEEASGFGSAGIFVLFGVALYARAGTVSALAACLCLCCGAAAWITGRYWLGVATPFLWSLLSACAGLALGIAASSFVPGRKRPAN